MSLAAFTGKLKEKKQAENLRNQAHHAISLFYEMKRCSGRKIQNDSFSSNVAAVGRTSFETSSSHTKNYLINQVVSSDYVCSDSKTSFSTSKTLSRTSVGLKQSGADWTEVFNELNDAVKMRHYFPKTLKTYSGWVRKLQTYTKSKDPRLVSVDDVKAFLTS